MKAERKRMQEIASLLKTKGAESVYRSPADLADDEFCAKALFPPPPRGVDPIEEALQKGDRLNAIRSYSYKHRVSYKEAKQAIDKMIQDKKPSK